MKEHFAHIAHIGGGSTTAHLMDVIQKNEAGIIVIESEEKERGIVINNQPTFEIKALSQHEYINPMFYDEKYSNDPKSFGMRKFKNRKR